MAQSKAKQLQKLLALARATGKLENLRETALEVGWTNLLRNKERKLEHQIQEMQDDILNGKSSNKKRYIFLTEEDYSRLNNTGEVILKKELVTERLQNSKEDYFSSDFEDFFSYLGMKKREDQDVRQYMETTITELLGF